MRGRRRPCSWRIVHDAGEPLEAAAGAGTGRVDRTVQRLEVSAQLLARNTVANLLGQAAPMAVAVVALPFVTRGLGPARFGILSIAWAVLSYLTVLDLGLGRATTKYVAEAIAKDREEEVPRILWTSATVELALGALGALALIAGASFLATDVLHTSGTLRSEAVATLRWVAPMVPVALLSSSLSGLLEAYQRFDLVNAVRLPSNVSVYLVPLLGVLAHLTLPAIMSLVLACRTGALLVLAVLDVHLFPALRRQAITPTLLRPLFSFGGWLTVSGVVGPVLASLDRFLLGSLVSLAALGQYSAPYEALTRLTVVATSLTASLFPVFSAMGVTDDRGRLEMLLGRAVKYVLVALGPLVAAIIVFAREGLGVWLGPDFAAASTMATQTLAVGVLVNSIALTPYALLQGVGRPDLPAKFHLLELPAYGVLAWVLVKLLGVPGAALAWTVRVAIDALLLFMASLRACNLRAGLFVSHGVLAASVSVLALTAVGLLGKTLAASLPLPTRAGLASLVVAGFAWVEWACVLDRLDRGRLAKAATGWLRPRAPGRTV